MEYASYLAGEKWSDHPACTHPLLAELARQVNDFTSDANRQRLAELVPDLIGLTGADLRLDVGVALHVAQAALPVVAEERQRMMAVAVLTCERLLADIDGRRDAPLSQKSREALDLAPAAAAWARRYARNNAISHRVFRRAAAPTIVRYAVQGVAYACVPDPDALLYDILIAAVAEFGTWRAPGSECRPTQDGARSSLVATAAGE